MKIDIDVKTPASSIYFYSGHITKKAVKYCFEVKDADCDLEVCWMYEYPFPDKSDVEDEIIDKYLKKMGI